VHYLWQKHRLKVEPSGAATTAAVRSGAIAPSGPTCWLVSGGNVESRAARGLTQDADAPLGKILVADDDASLVRTLS